MGMTRGGLPLDGATNFALPNEKTEVCCSFKLSQNHSRIKTPYFYGLWLCDLTSPVPHGGATVRRTHHVLE